MFDDNPTFECVDLGHRCFQVPVIQGLVACDPEVTGPQRDSTTLHLHRARILVQPAEKVSDPYLAVELVDYHVGLAQVAVPPLVA